MKGVLKGLEPERVLYYFEVLSNIQRGSGYEKPVSDWLKKFAEDRGYEVIQDEVYNIFMRVPGNGAGVNADKVLLHGHMDMVWNVAEGEEHDFFKEPLDLYIDDENWLRAKNTTLGADNGIGVAYMLALIEDDTYDHPPFEIYLSVMEELGKKGTDAFDMSPITAKRMINFNWVDDKQIVVSCEGDQSLKIKVPCAYQPAPKGMEALLIQIAGLRGGHCEWDIHAERANANKLAGRLLKGASKKFDICLVDIEGGVQNNVIPAFANINVLVAKENKDAFVNFVAEHCAEVKAEYKTSDPEITYTVSASAAYPEKVVGKGEASALYSILHLMPNGFLGHNAQVCAMKTAPFCEVYASCGGFPTEIDNNLGIMRTENGEIWMITTITAMSTTRKHDVADQIAEIVELVGNGATIEQFGVDACEFPYNPDSKMAKIAFDAYKESYGFEPQLEINCCSLEIGMLVKNCGLDCVSLGTEINGVHCAEECMKLDSVKKAWDMVVLFMKKLCVE